MNHDAAEPGEDQWLRDGELRPKPVHAVVVVAG
jgi:hypothetical protein